MAYTALYRKFRPQTLDIFNAVVGSGVNFNDVDASACQNIPADVPHYHDNGDFFINRSSCCASARQQSRVKGAPASTEI